MEQDIKVHVGWDVHQDTMAIACAEAGRAPARVVGVEAHDLGKLVKALAKLGRPQELLWCTRRVPPDSACTGRWPPGATAAT